MHSFIQSVHSLSHSQMIIFSLTLTFPRSIWLRVTITIRVKMYFRRCIGGHHRGFRVEYNLYNTFGLFITIHYYTVLPKENREPKQFI